MMPICLQTGPLAVNTYIIPCAPRSECMFVVDPGGDAASIIERMKGRDLAGIVLTHGHFDHLGAVPELKKRYPAARLCIHKADAKYIGKNALFKHKTDFGFVGASYLIDEFEAVYSELPEADILLDGLSDEKSNAPVTLSFAPEWQVFHTPGHTPGSLCLYNRSDKILLSGDTLFASSCGRTDFAGGSKAQLKKSLAFLLRLPADTRVFPGHGDFTSIGKEQCTGFDIYFV